MSLRRNFTWILGSKVSIILATLLTGTLINRSLGPFGRGIFAEIQTWVDLFIIVFGLSIEVGIYHFSNKVLYGSNNKSRLTTIFLLSLIYAIVAVLALTLCMRYWPKQFSVAALNYVVILNILVFTTMVATNLTIFLQAIGNIKFSAFIGIAQALINVGVIGYGYLFGVIDIKFVVNRLVVIQVVSLLILFLIFLKEKLIPGRFSIAMAKRMIVAGVKQHIATMAVFVYTRVNQLIVFRYCGESEAGIFAVSLNLAFALIFIPEIFRIVLYPRVIHSNDDYEVTIRSLRLGFYGWGIVSIVMILFAKPLLLIYAGTKFLPSVNVFRILIVATWFLTTSFLLTPYYVKIGAFGVASFSAALLGIISIGLNLLLVPRYAAIGAAIATAITCMTGFCMAILFLRYLSKKNPFVIFRPDFRNEIIFLGNYIPR